MRIVARISFSPATLLRIVAKAVTRLPEQFHNLFVLQLG